jgi:multidrug efflux pump
MSISGPFIARPVATTLMTIALALAGVLGYQALPVSPLPQVDFPTVSVSAQLPGASPDVVATSLAAPLERRLGQIADVTEMTSQSQTGQARITLQFGLDRNIDGAAQDVQAAINAAQADLPTNLLSQPTYRKVNPADAPVLILSLTSKTLTRGQMYDAASNVLQQEVSRLSGVGQVIIGGAAQPAVRVEVDPLALSRYGMGLEDVRSALANANANAPKGDIEIGDQRWQIYTNDQASHADDYKDMVVAYRDGDALRLRDIADVQDSVQDVRNLGLANGQPAVLVIIFRQPGANIITTVDAVRHAIPQLKAAMPADINIAFASDRSTTIRASLKETQRTLVIAALLVIGVVYLFLRNGRAALIPAVTVPISIIATFGAMYLFGFSLDNLSLMALTIATGFVVDDAIVVLENISRYLEDGMSRREAAIRGAREISFTVVSISVSLIAVFIPILLMGGIVGRLFREFAMTLSLAILVSMVVALTTTPMMCALMLRVNKRSLSAISGRKSLFERIQDAYARSLAVALNHSLIVLLSLAAVIALNAYLFSIIPKGFFPEQDTGRINAMLVADQGISFSLMSKKLTQMMDIVHGDPAVEAVVGFSGSGGGGAASQTNTGTVFISLKPLSERDGVEAVMGRLRRKLANVPGGRLFMQPVQDIRVGGRQANAEYQYSILGDRTDEVYEWAPKLLAALERDKTFVDLNSDQQQRGLETDISVDRDAASRLGLTMYQIDNTLYDAFGQRSVSTIYSAVNQYHVVMEVAPKFSRRPQTLDDSYISSSGGQPSGSQTTQLSAVSTGTATGVTTPSAASVAVAPAALSSSAASATNASFAVASNVVPLAPSTSTSSASNTSASGAVRTAAQAAIASTGGGMASTGSAVSTAAETISPLVGFTKYQPGHTPLAVNHQSQYVATTLSFNLAPGKSLSDATEAIAKAGRDIQLPGDLTGQFAGTAMVYQQSLDNEGFLVLAAIATIYIVLGILYESFIHPITILSTLPSAGVGAVVALMIFNIPFTIIALIGVILLIGIVKKNAIMMIDFALRAERDEGLSSRDAIFQAAIMRFRPIMMTTIAAMLGALPLCVSTGEGGELRQPLGIAIVGGLIVSQALTLYTTPIVYLYLDRFTWRSRHPGRQSARPA